MYRLQVKTHFDAAHYIRDYQGKCSREHGHRWEVEVVVEGRVLDEMNMLVDFVEVKSRLGTLIDMVDHRQLNEQFGGEPNMTAEYLSKWFYDNMKVFLSSLVVLKKLVCVTVWESPDCCVEYRE